MLEELDNKKKDKNYDFYFQHVQDEYTKDQNDLSKTTNLIKKKE